ncbi:MAG: AAA family ATPase, partial [Solirubrobacterales bacterium]|nr:AAA family ATPase [Solirubrobacterales bacterium]
MRLVARPRLLSRLESGRSGRVTLVCAPTGSGKTSVLAEWARASDALFVWVALDRRDDEPLRFWRCVVSGLALVSPAAAATSLRRLSSPVVAIGEEILPVLVNDVADMDRPLLIVLDDFHVIGDREIHEQLDYLIERLPHNTHIVVAGHT